MIPSALLLTTLFFAAPANAAPGALDCGIPPDSEPCPAWTARYEGAGGSGGRATAIAVAHDGSAVFVGGVGAEGVTPISY